MDLLLQFMNYVVVMVTLIKNTGLLPPLHAICRTDTRGGGCALSRRSERWAKMTEGYWLRLSLRGLLWELCKTHVASGSQAAAAQKVQAKALNSQQRAFSIFF